MFLRAIYKRAPRLSRYTYLPRHRYFHYGSRNDSNFIDLSARRICKVNGYRRLDQYDIDEAAEWYKTWLVKIFGVATLTGLAYGKEHPACPDGILYPIVIGSVGVCLPYVLPRCVCTFISFPAMVFSFLLFLMTH